MTMNRMLLALLLALVLANTAGCAASDRAKLFRPMGTAPHDPPQGRALFEQLPNWDNAAQVRCGGHLRQEDMKPGMSRWC
jgi:hypothetical protein